MSMRSLAYDLNKSLIGAHIFGGIGLHFLPPPGLRRLGCDLRAFAGA